MFAELAFESTPLGDISLRKRTILSLDREVYEVKLDDEWLMSSLFTTVEEKLAELGLAALGSEGPPGPHPGIEGRPDSHTENSLAVVIGGLGLGHTAHEALRDPRVAELVVIDAIQPVIDWHHQGLVPLGEELSNNPRCRLVHGDFFHLAMHPEEGFDPDTPARIWDAVLLDIDHSPEKLLNPQNADFYTAAGLAALARQIRPGGVFAMWSDDPPHDGFLELLATAFDSPESHIVPFENPLQGTESRSTVYVAKAR